MSTEKFRVIVFTNTCEKKIFYIPATKDINTELIPFQTVNNGLIIVCEKSRIIRRIERIPGSSSKWKDVALPVK